jgi:hypothetical protein
MPLHAPIYCLGRLFSGNAERLSFYVWQFENLWSGSPFCLCLQHYTKTFVHRLPMAGERAPNGGITLSVAIWQATMTPFCQHKEMLLDRWIRPKSRLVKSFCLSSIRGMERAIVNPNRWHPCISWWWPPLLQASLQRISSGLPLFAWFGKLRGRNAGPARMARLLFP